MSKDNQNIQELVNNVRQNIQTFEKGVAGHIADEAVLVIGSTKSGKSTFMNMLANKQIEIFKKLGAFRVDVAGEKDINGQIITDSKGKIVRNYAGEIKAESFLPIQIGHKASSKTKFPNYIMVNGKQFWDCPGFGDTRDHNVEISNMYYIYHILKYATRLDKGGVKFVIVQDHDGTETSRSTSFKDAINTICKLFPPLSRSPQNPNEIVLNFEALTQLIDSTTFVFTKVRSNDINNNKYLEDVLARATPELSTITINSQKDIKDIMYIAFLQKMQEMHKQDSTRIKHIEIPQATRGMNPENLLNLDVISKFFHIDTPAIKNCSPNLVADREAIDILTEYAHTCQIELKTKSKFQLQSQLIEIFKNMPNSIASSKIRGIFEIINTTQKSTLENEGATALAEKLLIVLTTFSSDLSYVQTLTDIYKTLELFRFCNDILPTPCLGADFIHISCAITEASKDYITAEEIRQQKQFNDYWSAYIREQEMLPNTFGKMVCTMKLGQGVATLGLVSSIMITILGIEASINLFRSEPNFIKDFKDLAKEELKFVWNISRDALHTVYGELSKPNEPNEKQFYDLKEQAEAILSGETSNEIFIK